VFENFNFLSSFSCGLWDVSSLLRVTCVLFMSFSVTDYFLPLPVICGKNYSSLYDGLMFWLVLIYLHVFYCRYFRSPGPQAEILTPTVDLGAAHGCAVLHNAFEDLAVISHPIYWVFHQTGGNMSSYPWWAAALLPVYCGNLHSSFLFPFFLFLLLKTVTPVPVSSCNSFCRWVSYT
jgi:hypothetical protein